MLKSINVENEKILLKNHITRNKEILNLLNSIKFKKRPNGEEYKDPIKNIDMSSIEDIVNSVYYFKSGDEKTSIIFSIKSTLNEATRFYLDIKSYNIVGIDKERIIPNYSFPYYLKNVEEMKVLIEEQKKEYQDAIKRCETRLNVFDKAISEANAFFEEFDKKYDMLYIVENCIKD